MGYFDFRENAKIKNAEAFWRHKMSKANGIAKRQSFHTEPRAETENKYAGNFDLIEKLNEAIEDSPHNPDPEHPDTYVVSREFLNMVLAACLGGKVVVPEEPTEAMMEAYKDAFISTERFNMKKVWRAMLDAYKGEGNG